MSTARLIVTLADTLANILDGAGQLDGADVHEGRARHVIDRIRLDDGALSEGAADRLAAMLVGTGRPEVTAVEDLTGGAPRHDADDCEDCEAANEAASALRELPETLKEALEHFGELVRLAPLAGDPVALWRMAQALDFQAETYSSAKLIEHAENVAKRALSFDALRRHVRGHAGGRRLVIIESPFAGDVEANVAYARRCLRDSLDRGEAPIASHLLYTQPGVLDDGNAGERNAGIEAGLAWGRMAAATVVYADRGVSPGMGLGIARANTEGRPVEFRRLDGGRNEAR